MACLFSRLTNGQLSLTARLAFPRIPLRCYSRESLTFILQSAKRLLFSLVAQILVTALYRISSAKPCVEPTPGSILDGSFVWTDNCRRYSTHFGETIM